ncbi:unnamed protein product [Timema podura]|uniref:Uncharacterized protein n=1 Tax=Timema podura TaxID=61482 RepID=A0ABN7NSG1_TIMPD|nr:unnamed protein product [Timema podura]
MNINTTNNGGRYLNTEQDLKQILNTAEDGEIKVESRSGELGSMTSLYRHRVLLNYGSAVCGARGQIRRSCSLASTRVGLQFNSNHFTLTFIEYVYHVVTRCTAIYLCQQITALPYIRLQGQTNSRIPMTPQEFTKTRRRNGSLGHQSTASLYNCLLFT